MGMHESTHQKLQFFGRQLRSDHAVDQQTEPERMPLLKEDYITVFQTCIDGDALPFDQSSQFFLAEFHPGLCGASSTNLNQSRRRLDIIPHLIKSPHSQRRNLQSARRRQGIGLIQQPPALLFPEQQKTLEERCRNAESILEIGEKRFSVILFCQFWP